jgi:hypothetical protein
MWEEAKRLRTSSDASTDKRQPRRLECMHPQHQGYSLQNYYIAIFLCALIIACSPNM